MTNKGCRYVVVIALLGLVFWVVIMSIIYMVMS